MGDGARRGRFARLRRTLNVIRGNALNAVGGTRTTAAGRVLPVRAVKTVEFSEN